MVHMFFFMVFLSECFEAGWNIFKIFSHLTWFTTKSAGDPWNPTVNSRSTIPTDSFCGVLWLSGVTKKMNRHLLTTFKWPKKSSKSWWINKSTTLKSFVPKNGQKICQKSALSMTWSMTFQGLAWQRFQNHRAEPGFQTWLGHPPNWTMQKLSADDGGTPWSG